MINVPDSDFQKLLNMNLERFYYNLPQNQKNLADNRDQVAELIKQCPEYKHIEQAIIIVLKCCYNLKSNL